MKSIKYMMVILAVSGIVGLTGCGKSGNQEQNSTSKQESTQESKDEAPVAENALEILETVWASYGDDEKFPVGGGDSNNMVMDAPGAFNPQNADELDATLAFPANKASEIDDAASMMHMMNANNFACGVYHVTGDVESLIEAIKGNITNRQWICGFPETLLIATVGNDYMVTAFGSNEIVETFKTKLTTAYESATVVCEEALNQ